MRRLTRALAAFLLGTLAVFAAGTPASAAADPCNGRGTGYGAGGVCVVAVLRANPGCSATGALTVNYKVTVTGTTATKVDLHWLKSGGSEVVLAGQPLAGTVAWPASIPIRATQVRFVAGGDAVVTVDPTTALAPAACVGDPATLASTGSETGPIVAIGGALLIAGAGILLARAAQQRRAAR